MNLDEISFKIGMQYENWEFDLDIIETEVYDKYRYNKKIDTLFNLAIKDVFLTFDLDILFKVEIVFKPRKKLYQFKKIIHEVIIKHGLRVINYEINPSRNKYEFRTLWRYQINILILHNNIKTNSLSLCITNKKYLFPVK